jgi:hypothetical protein
MDEYILDWICGRYFPFAVHSYSRKENVRNLHHVSIEQKQNSTWFRYHYFISELGVGKS